MAERAAAVPVLPGKKAKLEEFVSSLNGPKRKEFAESEKRCKINKETWFLQSTPHGDTLIIYFEAKNPAKASEDWRTSKHPFDLWVKEQAKEITGIDFSDSPLGERPKQILRYAY